MALRLDGAVACATGLEQPSTFANSDWFIRTLANDDFTVTGKVELPGVDQQRLLASLPLRAEGGKIVGIVAMALRRTWLMDVMLSDDGQPLANPSAHLPDQRGSAMAESAVGAAADDGRPPPFSLGPR